MSESRRLGFTDSRGGGASLSDEGAAGTKRGDAACACAVAIREVGVVAAEPDDAALVSSVFAFFALESAPAGSGSSGFRFFDCACVNAQNSTSALSPLKRCPLPSWNRQREVNRQKSKQCLIDFSFANLSEQALAVSQL